MVLGGHFIKSASVVRYLGSGLVSISQTLRYLGVTLKILGHVPTHPWRPRQSTGRSVTGHLCIRRFWVVSLGCGWHVHTPHSSTETQTIYGSTQTIHGLVRQARVRNGIVILSRPLFAVCLTSQAKYTWCYRFNTICFFLGRGQKKKQADKSRSYASWKLDADVYNRPGKWLTDWRGEMKS